MHQLEYQLEETSEIAAQLISEFSKYRIWLLEGNLGAGKTTLVQEITKHSGVQEEVTSPTFSLVNEYKTTLGGKIYHLDLYRLQQFDELYEIGMFEIEESGYFCLIEWASAVGYIPAVSYLSVTLEYVDPVKRRITVLVHEN
ncbi:MAG TPA: tRNA (adenosine(37)-N6)-threonylcarbamoyltransferase complex ATPase subunit type 1 TsaE [Catalimonadaceae bacterium]|nr:tRNA (adenosine(37)-N6)-threonylcarbamoyltransferase complex ATPase subunit type 1 TsaE [Catalimonadaceae bacterium]HPI10900.1 tRNA (adenosine(37)-N6)-threonylcarbamoyltransferase complex ATPase subunit type 1 TsaE [Catalimonadaceae bacterium]